LEDGKHGSNVILGFIFEPIVFVCLEKFTRRLKEKGILEQEYKEE
jgi:hypothetical protein